MATSPIIRVDKKFKTRIDVIRKDIEDSFGVDLTYPWFTKNFANEISREKVIEKLRKDKEAKG